MKKHEAKTHNNNPGKDADVEPDTSAAFPRPFENEQFTSPVSIRICSHRSRSCDPDGISAKAIIDGLVKSGILADDSAKYVAEVIYCQEKAQSANEEKTVVTIEEI